MRLFISIQLSEEMKTSVIGTMHALKKAGVKGSFVPAQNLHLTLAFVGETEDVQAVKDALKTVKIKPFRLALAEAGDFGDTLWIGLRGSQGLSSAARSVRDALDAAQIGYDRKKFVPHITIVRRMSGKMPQIPAPKGDMMVKKISLMRSDQRDGKRVYSEIFSV